MVNSADCPGTQQAKWTVANSCQPRALRLPDPKLEGEAGKEAPGWVNMDRLIAERVTRRVRKWQWPGHFLRARAKLSPRKEEVHQVNASRVGLTRPWPQLQGL